MDKGTLLSSNRNKLKPAAFAGKDKSSAIKNGAGGSRTRNPLHAMQVRSHCATAPGSMILSNPCFTVKLRAIIISSAIP